jgi:hypothetical protein
MPARYPLPDPPPEGARAKRAAPVSGKAVTLMMLAIGLSVVLGVGVFAALTRPPRHPQPAGSSSAPRHIPFSSPPQGGAHVF